MPQQHKVTSGFYLGEAKILKAERVGLLEKKFLNFWPDVIRESKTDLNGQSSLPSLIISSTSRVDTTWKRNFLETNLTKFAPTDNFWSLSKLRSEQGEYQLAFQNIDNLNNSRNRRLFSDSTSDIFCWKYKDSFSIKKPSKWFYTRLFIKFLLFLLHLLWPHISITNYLSISETAVLSFGKFTNLRLLNDTLELYTI